MTYTRKNGRSRRKKGGYSWSDFKGHTNNALTSVKNTANTQYKNVKTTVSNAHAQAKTNQDKINADHKIHDASFNETFTNNVNKSLGYYKEQGQAFQKNLNAKAVNNKTHYNPTQDVDENNKAIQTCIFETKITPTLVEPIKVNSYRDPNDKYGTSLTACLLNCIATSNKVAKAANYKIRNKTAAIKADQWGNTSESSQQREIAYRKALCRLSHNKGSLANYDLGQAFFNSVASTGNFISKRNNGSKGGTKRKHKRKY